MKTTISLLIAMATSIPALGGEASGEFSTNKREKIRPKYAAAFETRDQRDARKRVIEVVGARYPEELQRRVGK